MTADDIIDGILAREGEGTPPYLAAGDAGGRTSWGISERAHPEAWRDGPPTLAMARVIYFHQYVAPFDVLAEYGVDERIRVVLIDDGVLSGVVSAIRRLQVVLGVVADGRIGTQTIAAAMNYQPSAALVTAYCVERAVRLARLVQHEPKNLPFLVGWISRALSFLP